MVILYISLCYISMLMSIFSSISICTCVCRYFPQIILLILSEYCSIDVRLLGPFCNHTESGTGFQSLNPFGYHIKSQTPTSRLPDPPHDHVHFKFSVSWTSRPQFPVLFSPQGRGPLSRTLSLLVSLS